MSNGKLVIINLIVGSIKHKLLYKMKYFCEQYTLSKTEIKFELDLPK